MAEADVLAAIAALPTDADVQAAVAAALLVYDPPAGTNYCTNPRFLTDANADGQADGVLVTPGKDAATVYTCTLPGDGQRIRAVGGAGANQWLGIGLHKASAGTFAAGDPLTISALVTVHENSGNDLAFTASSVTAAGALVNTRQTALPATDTPTRISATIASAGATTNSALFWLTGVVGQWHSGDVLDLTIQDVLIEKSSVPTPYFDGSYPNCAWTAGANASTSVRSMAKVIAALRALVDAVKLKSDTIPASPAAVGSAMTLTTGERASIATSVWAAATRTLSGFGTLAADVWASAARALTDKTGFSGTATNMVAAAPIATANASAVRTNLTTELARIDENVSAAKTLTSGERTSIASAVSGLATTGLAALKTLLDAVKLKSDTIGTGQAIVISPITPSGTITVYSGDDYASADSRAITVTVADTGHVLGLDGAVVKLKATQVTWEAASVVSTTDGYTVTFEATAAQTAAVTRAQKYELEATLANGHVVTLAKGSLVTRTNIPAVV